MQFESKELLVHGYTVKKLPLGAYFSLLSKIEKIPANIAFSLSSSGDSTEKVVAMIQKICTVAPDMILDIISSATGETRQKIEEDRDLGIEGLVDLLLAIWEINELSKAFDSVKKKIPALGAYFEPTNNLSTT